MTEVILLGDPVVYKEGSCDWLGVVTKTGSSFKVLWNGEQHHRTEIYNRLRLAELAEVDAGCRLHGDKSND